MLDTRLVTIPLTDELYDEINRNQGKVMDGFDYLTDQIGLFCSEISKLSKTAYVEAEYFGGVGSQNGWYGAREKLYLKKP